MPEETKEQIGKRLEKLGWTKEPFSDVYVKEWNLIECNSDGNYELDNREEEIKDIVYCEYHIDLESEEASYIIYSGGNNPGDAGIMDDDYENVLEDALKDELFWSVEPPKFETIVDTGSIMRYCFINLIRAKKDFLCCRWGCQKGDYFLKYMNNSNVKANESNKFFEISEEQAKEIMALEDEEEQFALMCKIWDERWE